MKSLRELMGKMYNNLGEEKRDINQFYLASCHTVTELYRTNSFVEQLRAIIRKLDNSLIVHESLSRIMKPTERESKEYAELVKDISTELQILKATHEAMDDNLREIQESENMQFEIRGRMVDLKKEISRMIGKVEKILGR